MPPIRTKRLPGGSVGIYDLQQHLVVNVGGSPADPHPQYLLKYDYASGGGSGNLAAHKTDPNAHIGYYLPMSKVTENNINDATTVPTSSLLFTINNTLTTALEQKAPINHNHDIVYYKITGGDITGSVTIKRGDGEQLLLYGSNIDERIGGAINITNDGTDTKCELQAGGKIGRPVDDKTALVIDHKAPIEQSLTLVRVDDTGATTDELPILPTSHLSANGYVKLPGGLIMQWGRVDIDDTTDAVVDITFPIPFTTECYNVTTTTIAKSGTNVASGQVNFDADTNEIGISELGVKLNTNHDSGNVVGYYWQAIGR